MRRGSSSLWWPWCISKESSQGSSFLRRKALSPSTSRQRPRNAHHQEPEPDHPPSPVVVLSPPPPPPPPPPLRPLRAHPPLHPTAISGSRIPRSPPYTTHAPYDSNPDKEAQSAASLLLANHQPGGHSSTAGHLPFAPPHKAPPGADTLLRCCYPREA